MFSNSIKLDDEWISEVGKNIYLERRLKNLSTKSKISQSRFMSTKKSKSEFRETESSIMREKMIKIIKIHVTLSLKL